MKEKPPNRRKKQFGPPYNNGTSKYAQHLPEDKHSIDRIHNTTEILHIMKKGKLMDTREKFHIYQETNLGSQINDKNTVSQNTLTL